MVDLAGIEPATSSMPWKRAPSCATGPHAEGCNSPIVSAGAGFVKHWPHPESGSVESGLERGIQGDRTGPKSEGRAQPGSGMGGSRPPRNRLGEQNFRDREHFGWGPVSKTIEGAGHQVFYRCFVSRALQDRAPGQHRSPRRAGGSIWGRRAEWPQPETGRWVRRRFGRSQECLSCGKVGGH
jgi:hypothetical protein